MGTSIKENNTPKNKTSKKIDHFKARICMGEKNKN